MGVFTNERHFGLAGLCEQLDLVGGEMTILLAANMAGMKAYRVIRKSRSEGEACKILMLTTYGDTTTILGMLKAGADGYVLKDEDPSVIPAAIRTILSGEIWLSKPVSEKVLEVAKGQKEKTLEAARMRL